MKTLKVIYAIWLREFKQFIRERSRIIGMVGQPLLYLLVVGNGISAGMRFTTGPAGMNYLQFMYPGIIGMSLLFTSIFSAVSIIWDREFGFLKEVLVAPVPRWAVAVGKALGGSTVAMIQGTILLLLAPFVGIHLTAGMVVKLLLTMLLLSFGLTSLGITVAARMESMQAFQMVMNFLVMPLYFLSGAMFPLPRDIAWLNTVMKIDPLTYGVDALRHILYAGTPLVQMTQFSLAVDLTVASVCALVLATTGAALFSKQA